MSFLLNRTCTLNSGSAGNSIFVQNEDSSILIDAGISSKRLIDAMKTKDLEPSALSGILITHEHSDHVAGLCIFAKCFKLPIYMSQGTWNSVKHRMDAQNYYDIHIIHAGQTFEINSMAVKAFAVPHDANEPLGFRIDTGKAVVALASDVGEWTPTIEANMLGADFVYLEANYDEKMLYEGSYPWPLKKRISSKTGHLSNMESAMASHQLLESGSSRFVLIHLSENNNTPELAYFSVESHLRFQGASRDVDYQLSTAPRYSPSVWYYL